MGSIDALMFLRLGLCTSYTRPRRHSSRDAINPYIYSRSTLTDSATHPATGAARQLPTQHRAKTQSFVGAISPSKAARRDAQFAGRPPLLARSGSLCQTRPAKSTLATPAPAVAPARPTHCRHRISNVEHPSAPGHLPPRT